MVYKNTTEVAQLHGVPFYLKDVVDASLYGKLNVFLQGDTGSGKTQLAQDARQYFPDKSLFILGRNDMDTRELFQQINLEKLRKGKTKKGYVIEFEKDLNNNLLRLRAELLSKTYKPKPLKRFINFIIREPKTRIIHSSDFADRIIYHALVNVLEPIYEKIFIYDSYASRKGKGTHAALKRFDAFKRKVTKNGKLINNYYNNNSVKGYCLKADIKHYFQTVDHEIMMNIISKSIKDKDIMQLIKNILDNFISPEKGKGMPLGNLTSQFFANIYLNELDYFVKHKLKARYYLRYVDDLVLLHHSKQQLEEWKKEIYFFLKERTKLELHPEKSKVIPLSKGIDFVGFRNFYHFKLLRKRNIRAIERKITLLHEGLISQKKFYEIYQGWNAHASWANTYKLRKTLENKTIAPVFSIFLTKL